MRQLAWPTVAATVLGAASAFGDWLWAAHLTDGALLPAVVHGVTIFALLAVLLSLQADGGRSLGRHLLALPLVGLALAALFYPLAGLVGYLPALLLSWLGMWLGLALVRDWAPYSPATWIRGLVAGVASGLSFWTISDIWTAAGPAADTFGWSQHALRALQWTWAFLPGFVALMWRGRPNPPLENDSTTKETA